jgi:invasion protein IalB
MMQRVLSVTGLAASAALAFGSVAAEAASALQLVQGGDYTARHRDWQVNCSACARSEEQLCTIFSTVRDRSAGRDMMLSFYLNSGTKPTLALDVPVLGPTPVRFVVDEQEPTVLLPPEITHWGMTGELALDSEYATEQLVDAFRRGGAVTITFSDAEFVTRMAKFSLRGFGAALDDMIAHLPVAPPFCDD